MVNTIINDKNLWAEFMSAIAFFVIAFTLATTKAGHVDTAFFWSLIMVCFAVLQFVSIQFREDLKVLRICMAWIAGVTWSWFALSTLNTVVVVPALCIGIFNMYSFIGLTNRATIDWYNIFRK